MFEIIYLFLHNVKLQICYHFQHDIFLAVRTVFRAVDFQHVVFRQRHRDHHRRHRQGHRGQLEGNHLHVPCGTR